MKSVLLWFTTSFQSSFISHNASHVKKRHTYLYQRKVLVVITNVNKNSYVCNNFSKTPQYEISLKPSQLLLYFFHAARRTGWQRHGWTKKTHFCKCMSQRCTKICISRQESLIDFPGQSVNAVEKIVIYLLVQKRVNIMRKKLKKKYIWDVIK